MRFFTYLILLSSIFVKYSSSNYIQCTSDCSQITISFAEPLKIPTECKEDNNTTNIYDYASVCIINYRIDYDSKQIYVNFKASNDTNALEKHNQSQILVQTIWLGLNQESTQPNLTQRKYECNTKKDCARQFYLDTIERLITNGKAQLDEIHSNLYNQSSPISKSTRRRCIDSSRTGNKTAVRCGTGLCYAYYVNDQSSKKQSCNYDITPILFSEMIYYLPDFEMNKKELIEYKCNTNLCNKKLMIEKIQKILNEYTNWNMIIPKDEIGIIKKSLAIHRTVSYYLISLSLIILRFLS
jgi:hypothetical protein